MSCALMRRCAAAVLATFLGLAGAQRCLAHGDVWVYRDVDNTLSLGLADETGTDFTATLPVYEAILIPDTLPFSPFDASAEDPGFLAGPGDLPPSEPLALAFDALSVWNGSSLVPAAGLSFSMDLSGGIASSPAGALHEHPQFGLIDGTADSQPIPDGAYVVSFRASMSGLNDSERGYFVMLHDALIANEDDAEELSELLEEYENGGTAPIFAGKDFSFFEEVHEYVEASIPEPSGLGLAVIAIGLAATRRCSKA